MKARLAVVISFTILVIDQTTKSTAEIRRDKLHKLKGTESGDVHVVVNERNFMWYRVPIGTTLKVDEKTKLYIPPELSDNFTADDRITLTWNYKLTKDKYCKVGPGDLEHSRVTYSYYRHTWCRNSVGEDLCCGDDHKCNCNFFDINCECSHV